MTVYILNLVMIYIYSIVYSVFRARLKAAGLRVFFVTLVTVQLIFVLAARHVSIGVDVPGYVSYFGSVSRYQSLEALLADGRFEVGYKLLNRLISRFTTSEQVFLGIMAIVSTAPVGRFIYRYSKMPFLSFALYIAFGHYSFNFSGLRQAIAFACALISYDYIKSKKLIKFLTCVFVASMFHKSALVFLPAYFIANKRLDRVTVGSIIFLDVLVFLFRRQIFTFVINIFYNDYQLVESSSYSWMFLCLAIVLMGALSYKNVIAVSESNNALYTFLTAGVSLMLFASVGTNVMRMADYYYIFVILFIPEVISAVKDKRLMLLGAYILVGCATVLYLWGLGMDGYQIVPYRLFWE